jgi:predicted nucleotidyltransferase
VRRRAMCHGSFTYQFARYKTFSYLYGENHTAMNVLVEQKLPEIRALCKKHHVERLYLFGSATGDNFTDKSDFDFLYLFNDKFPFMDYADNFFDFADALEALMGREIDLVPEKSLSNPYFIASIERSKQLLYAA